MLFDCWRKMEELLYVPLVYWILEKKQLCFHFFSGNQKTQKIRQYPQIIPRLFATRISANSAKLPCMLFSMIQTSTNLECTLTLTNWLNFGLFIVKIWWSISGPLSSIHPKVLLETWSKIEGPLNVFLVYIHSLKRPKLLNTLWDPPKSILSLWEAPTLAILAFLLYFQFERGGAFNDSSEWKRVSDCTTYLAISEAKNLSLKMVTHDWRAENHFDWFSTKLLHREMSRGGINHGWSFRNCSMSIFMHQRFLYCFNF